MEYIENAAKGHADVHVVTQLTISLLGLVVFPKEKLLLEKAATLSIDDMKKQGWPSWTILLDDPKKPTANLAVLLKHLRNAICHARLLYNSDSRSIDDVTIRVEDQPSATCTKNWAASIGASDLRLFCDHFINFIEQTIG